VEVAVVTLAMQQETMVAQVVAVVLLVAIITQAVQVEALVTALKIWGELGFLLQTQEYSAVLMVEQEVKAVQVVQDITT
jgi:hypothetical protein